MQKRGVGQLNVGNKIGHVAGREAPDQDLFVRVLIAVVVGRVDAGGGESGRGLKGRPGRLGLRGFGRFSRGGRGRFSAGAQAQYAGCEGEECENLE